MCDEADKCQTLDDVKVMILGTLSLCKVEMDVIMNWPSTIQGKSGYYKE
jgi:hypothetical protein